MPERSLDERIDEMRVLLVQAEEIAQRIERAVESSHGAASAMDEAASKMQSAASRMGEAAGTMLMAGRQ